MYFCVYDCVHESIVCTNEACAMCMGHVTSPLQSCYFSGTVGDWKDHFTVKQNEEFDNIYQERLGDLDIPFVYQL